MNNKERDSEYQYTEYQDTKYQDAKYQDTEYSSTSEELRDVLIAISVVAKRLAKKYEDKSKEWYQLDPLGQYNDEIIHEHSYDDFVKALNELTFEDVEWYFDDLDKEEYERD